MDKEYNSLFKDDSTLATPKLTPMIKQYLEIKSKYEDSVLLFRMGDFYEVFFDDATLLSNILGLTLTKRAGVQMAGVPYHSLDNYLSKLIKLSKKVAICEQMENPKDAKGIVKREVTQVITPGTILEKDYLDSKTNNYLLSFMPSKDYSSLAIAICDISTGSFLGTTINTHSKEDLFNKLIEEINKFSPKEIMTHDYISETKLLEQVKTLYPNLYYSKVEDFTADYSYAYKTLNRHFNTISLKGFGLEGQDLLISLTGSVLHYISDLSKSSLQHINNIKLYDRNNTMNIDIATHESLEIVTSMKQTSNSPTLLKSIDKTNTSMGGRYLKLILLVPLTDVNDINERLENVEFFYKKSNLCENIREKLKEIGDLERISSKLSSKRINPKEMVALKKYLTYSLEIVGELALENLDIANIKEIEDIRHIIYTIEESILEEPKTLINEGDIIKETFSKKLKEYNRARHEGRNWINNLEAKYRGETNINTLKIRYNNVIGYYVEVTKANSKNMTDKFMKRQTLLGSERYTTEELMGYETKINEANEKGYGLELELFLSVRDSIIDKVSIILKLASVIANIDVFSSLAYLAVEKNYVRPIIDESNSIEIKEGRHPVVEDYLLDEAFIPNDIYLDNKEEHLLIITGPNMSGKSTYLRQTALIVLLAQIGSFVPAKSAKIGVVDRIFARVGANDNIARGESTFLVEMNETAYILNNATNRSLIVMDEIGRGTSTYDGLSIAWAIIEHFTETDERRSKVLFATHYHELTMLENIVGVKNYNVLVEEYKNNITFMKRVVEGAAKSSYGIYVAQIAGVPLGITKRANEILKELEEYGSVEVENIEGKSNTKKDKNLLTNNVQTETKTQKEESEIEEEIKSINVNNLTPIEALSLIYNWKNKLL